MDPDSRITASCLLSGLNAATMNACSLGRPAGVVAAQQPIGGGVVEVHPVLIVGGGDPAAVGTDVKRLQVAASGRRRPDQVGRFASAANRFTRVSGESSSRAPAAASSSERLMSSVSWDRAPTRRASAETAAWRAACAASRASAALRSARFDCTAATRRR